MSSSFFIAIDLPQDIKADLKSLCFGLPNVRWEEEQAFHLTLRHLGRLDGNTVLDIKECLSEVQFPTFFISLKNVNYSHANGNGSIQVGVESSTPFDNLKKIINKQLTAIHFPPEKKSPPSVLLGRFERESQEKLSFYLQANFAYASQPFEVKNFYLYSCRMTDKRTIYYEEECYGQG